MNSTNQLSFIAQYIYNYGLILQFIQRKENVLDTDVWMASEDFAYYSQLIPGCFYRLGTGNVAKGITSPIHTSTFDIDEDALKLSTGLMAYIAVKQLGN